MTERPHELPFVLDVPDTGIAVAHAGPMDLYRPAGVSTPLPAVVLIHGPVPEQAPVRPRDWPVFQGYARLAANQGLLGITLDLRYPTLASWPTAADQLFQLVYRIRARPEVDPDRIALWAFSAGALLLTPWLAHSPSWLRCLALSYPFLVSPQPPSPADKLRPGRPIVLTRVAQERPALQAAVTTFLTKANELHTPLNLIDVPNAPHAFDSLTPTPESRQAITEAMTTVHGYLQSDFPPNDVP